MHQRDLSRKERIFTYERLGAVDGIDQPQILGIERALAGLLPVEAVRGKALADQLADDLLGLDVGRSGDLSALMTTSRLRW